MSQRAVLLSVLFTAKMLSIKLTFVTGRDLPVELATCAKNPEPPH